MYDRSHKRIQTRREMERIKVIRGQGSVSKKKKKSPSTFVEIYPYHLFPTSPPPPPQSVPRVCPLPKLRKLPIHGLFKAGFTARAGPHEEVRASRHILNFQTESVPSDTVLTTFSFWSQEV